MTASTEVVDAVQQLLESEGVLQSIRAQLRAAVVNALAANDTERRSSKAIEFAAKTSGRGSILCVMDLLSKLNLRETMSVFEAEIGMKNTAVNTESARDDIIQRLNIVSSLRDLDQPILYQLLETPYCSNSADKSKLAPKTIEPHYQSEFKSPIIKVISTPFQQEQVAVSSSSSSPSAAKAKAAYADSSQEYKQRDAVTLGAQKSHSGLPLSGPTGDLDYDSNDDSIADDKKISQNTSDNARDHKNTQSTQDKKKSDPYAKYSDDSDDKSFDDESDRSEDEKSEEKSIGDFPDEEDIEEDELEVGAESESSASFSLEYGYVEDPKAEGKIESMEPLQLIKKDEKVEEKMQEKSVPNSKVTTPYQEVKSVEIAPAVKPQVTVTPSVKDKDKDTIPVSSSPDNAQKGVATGVQKLGQASITRSKHGWDAKEEDGDDFMFSEDAESNDQDSNSSLKGAVGSSQPMQGKASLSTVKDDHLDEMILEKTKSVKNSLQPATRSSWGSKTAESDDSESEDMSVGGGNAESMSEEEEEDSMEESGLHQQPETRQTTQEEDEEVSSGGNEGSLFMTRGHSGVLPMVNTNTTATTKQTVAPASPVTLANDTSLAYDDMSAEFDADADFSKDDGIYMSSQSSKLSEVERKLAEMERENSGLKALRLEDDSKVGKKGDVSARSNDEGDYSEGDFEYGSESEDGDADVNDEEDSKSVASEDIEAMDLSVGGAGSDSDQSFSGLNKDSGKMKNIPEKNAPGLWGAPSNKNQTNNTSNTNAPSSDYKPSLSKQKSSDNMSQSSADLEFSVSEFEMSGSKGIDSDMGYDFTAAAVPPAKSGRGPRDRSAGW